MSAPRPRGSVGMPGAPPRTQPRALRFLLRFGSRVKVVHFLGSAKPWDYSYDPQTGAVSAEGSGPVQEQEAAFLSLWWGIYQLSVLPLYGAERDRGSPGRTVSQGRSGD